LVEKIENYQTSWRTEVIPKKSKTGQFTLKQKKDSLKSSIRSFLGWLQREWVWDECISLELIDIVMNIYENKRHKFTYQYISNNNSMDIHDGTADI